MLPTKPYKKVSHPGVYYILKFFQNTYDDEKEGLKTQNQFFSLIELHKILVTDYDKNFHFTFFHENVNLLIPSLLFIPNDYEYQETDETSVSSDLIRPSVKTE